MFHRSNLVAVTTSHWSSAESDPNQRPPFTLSTRRAAWPCLLLALAFLSGCNREVRVPVFPVSGKVTVGGEIPVGAQVVLHPQGIELPPNVAATGTVQKDGTFKISVYDGGDGAPAGNYVVTLQWYKLITTEGGSGAGPNVVPKQYSLPDSSPIKVTVTQGENVIPDIQIPKS